jgi:hypothetical protein
MPTPHYYNALATRLHGRRRLFGLGFFVFLLLTALCILLVKARILPPLQFLLAGSVFLFVCAWCAGVYLLCDWFDPKEGYIKSSLGPRPRGEGGMASVARWFHDMVPRFCAAFLDVWFLGSAVLALAAIYRATF